MMSQGIAALIMKLFLKILQFVLPYLYYRELGKKAREEEEKLRRLLEEGHNIYQDYVKQGQQAKADKRVSLA